MSETWTGAFPAIAELVPHEAPIVAVDRLLAWQKGHAEAELTVRADDAFVREGRLDAVVLLEYLGQTVAACLGMEAYASGGNVRVGMIIAVRQMAIHRPQIAVGETLRLVAHCARGTDSLSHYDGEVRDASGALVVTATMTLVHGEKPPDG